MDFRHETISENLARFLNLIYTKIEIKDEIRNRINEDEYRIKLNAKFGLDTNFEHEVIESCYWLIEDTELAIQEFNKFGLQGPTRIKRNTGEKYLRLYGILNSIYLQKSVVVQLYEIFKIPHTKAIIKLFNDVELIKLRNKVAAHSVDYRDDNGSRDFFRISRVTIDYEIDGIHVMGKKGLEKYSVDKLLKEFKMVFNKELFNVCVFLMKRFFKEESKNFKELNGYLGLINERIKGNIVKRNLHGHGHTIIKSDKDKK